VFRQDGTIEQVLERSGTPSPLLLRPLERAPLLQRLPLRLIGIDLRPEYVQLSAKA
jgi:hypothetical protein